MDPRFDNDAQTTGTLPGIGAGALSMSGGASRPEPPAWLEETRADLGGPGRYLAFEQDGRVVVCPGQPGMDADRPLAGRRHPLRRRDGLTPSCPDRQRGGRRTRARRPLAQRHPGQRPARGVEPARRTATSSSIGRHALYFLDTVTAASGRRSGRADRVAASTIVAAAMADTIAVLSLKGGTGKTTTVRTLADVLRRVGLDVLADRPRPAGQPVGLLRRPAGRRAERSPTSSSGDAKAKEAIHSGIIPVLAEPGRGRTRAERASGPRGRTQEGAQGRAARSYDVILIDCPPALGLLTVNGLVAADWALISSEAQYFALQGVQGALDVIEQAREYYNDDLAVPRRRDEHSPTCAPRTRATRSHNCPAGIW